MKEKQPAGIFQTSINFATGTASNGSPTTVNATNLFDPAKLGLLDFADVFALSNVASLAGRPDSGNLLVLSQESGKLVETDRAGNVLSTLVIASDAGNPLSIADQQHEGVTMDDQGNLYLVNENGGGDFDHPQLWVCAPRPLPLRFSPCSLQRHRRSSSSSPRSTRPAVLPAMRPTGSS